MIDGYCTVNYKEYFWKFSAVYAFKNKKMLKLGTVFINTNVKSLHKAVFHLSQGIRRGSVDVA